MGFCPISYIIYGAFKYSGPELESIVGE